jgi:hypothetical protein
MQKQVLLEILRQSQFTSHFSFDRVSEDNASLRLNDKTASIGFIYRHIGETRICLVSSSTTIGQPDNGQPFDVEYSRQLISRGWNLTRFGRGGGVEHQIQEKTWKCRPSGPWQHRDCRGRCHFRTRLSHTPASPVLNCCARKPPERLLS